METNQTPFFLNSRLKCPDLITQQEAEIDLLLPEPRGLLGCLCSKRFTTLGYAVADIQFQSELLNDDKELIYLQAVLNTANKIELKNKILINQQRLSCANWAKSKRQIEASDVQLGVIVVTLNLIGG